MAKQAEEKLETHKPLAVRCIALKDGALYKAVCIDLGLYVQRSSLSDAMQELEELIHSYVRDAQEAGIPVGAATTAHPQGGTLAALCQALIGRTKSLG